MDAPSASQFDDAARRILGDESGQLRLGRRGLPEGAIPPSRALVPYDPEFAARQLGSMPNPRIRIVGFRGTGFSNWDSVYASGNEVVDRLVQSGHVGISFGEGKAVYGLRPSVAAMEQIPNLVETLKLGGEVPGQVFDDTAAFLRARELAPQGVRTQVYEMPVPVTADEYARIQRSVLAQVEDPSLTQMLYSYPKLNDLGRPLPMPSHCDNCATWPRVLGLPIPEETGQLKFYIRELGKLGTIWNP